jgi:hypothetical protein
MRIAGGGPGVTGAVPEALSVAAKDAFKGMIMTKAKMVGAMVLVSTMIAGGAVGLAQFGGGGFGGGPEAQEPPRKANVAASKKVRSTESPKESGGAPGPDSFAAGFGGSGSGMMETMMMGGMMGPAREAPLVFDLINEVEDDSDAIDALVEVAVMDLRLAREEYRSRVEAQSGPMSLAGAYEGARDAYVRALMQLAGIRSLLKERGVPEEELPAIEPLNLPAVQPGGDPFQAPAGGSSSPFQ